MIPTLNFFPSGTLRVQARMIGRTSMVTSVMKLIKELTMKRMFSLMQFPPPSQNAEMGLQTNIPASNAATQ
jgi:hypothetical protein